jgi:hemoglobin/transferrin/lactoferrin receptor protein
LVITPGLRYSYYNLDPRPDSNYKIVPGKAPGVVEEDNLSKQVGLVYKFTDNFSVFGRYAEGFKMPTAEQLFTSSPSATFNILPNPDLKPESVKSYEAGLRGKFERGYFSVSMFKADYKNFIQSLVDIGTSPLGVLQLTSVNRTVVEISGWEVFGELQLSDKWFANAAFTAQRGDQVLAPGQAMVPFNGVSPQTLVTGLKYVDPSLGLTGEFIGTFRDDVTRTQSAANFKPDGYAVFDTVWSWKLANNWTLRGAVYNIFDERYFAWPLGTTYNITTTTATKISNPLELQTQAGRTYRVGLSVTF